MHRGNIISSRTHQPKTRPAQVGARNSKERAFKAQREKLQSAVALELRMKGRNIEKLSL